MRVSFVANNNEIRFPFASSQSSLEHKQLTSFLGFFRHSETRGTLY